MRRWCMGMIIRHWRITSLRRTRTNNRCVSARVVRLKDLYGKRLCVCWIGWYRSIVLYIAPDQLYSQAFDIGRGGPKNTGAQDSLHNFIPSISLFASSFVSSLHLLNGWRP